jgi:hypothetical protein
MNDERIAQLLDELTPPYDHRIGDWEAVVDDAHRLRGVPSVRRPMRIAVALAAVAAFAMVVLAWPFQAQEGVLERALASIGDGPVLHVVLRGEWGGTLVDLESGARTPVHGGNEVWYDTERGLVHRVSRLGDAVQHEQVHRPKEPPPELEALGREYRQALEAGTARVAGEDEIDGEPVVWVTIRSELLPDVADGKDHEWAQQVAVSRRTYEPVALRETRDGEPGPGTTQRVLELELLPADAHRFEASQADQIGGRMFSEGREPVELAEARSLLGGRTPLWLGREFEGLPLAQAFRNETRTGRLPEVRLTGEQARAAEKCMEGPREQRLRCFRDLGLGSVSVREDGVFVSRGRAQWEEEQVSLLLFYGTLGDDESTYRKDVVPRFDQPYVTVTQSAHGSRWERGSGSYEPPPGSVFVGGGGRIGVVRAHGLRVTIESPREEWVLAAARALERMPG